MTKFQVLHLCSTVFLAVAFILRGVHMYQIEAKYDARYEWTTRAVQLNADMTDHLKWPGRYPLPAPVATQAALLGLDDPAQASPPPAASVPR